MSSIKRDSSRKQALIQINILLSKLKVIKGIFVSLACFPEIIPGVRPISPTAEGFFVEKATACFLTAAHAASEGSITHSEESATHSLPHSWDHKHLWFANVAVPPTQRALSNWLTHRIVGYTGQWQSGLNIYTIWLHTNMPSCFQTLIKSAALVHADLWCWF